MHAHTNFCGSTWSISMVLEVKKVKKGIFRQFFWWHFQKVQRTKKLRLDSCSPSNSTNLEMLCYRGLTIFFFFGAVTHLVPMTDICLSCLLDPLEPDFTVLYKTINLFLDLNVWEYILVDFYNSHMAATLICT